MRKLSLLMTLMMSQVGLAAPFLAGRVTDEYGRPIEGATVQILDCIGTCFGGATRLTDQNGDYVFEQRTFRNSPLLAVSMPGRYHASTDYRGPKLQAEDTDQPRRADFVLGTPAEITLRLDGDVPAGWKQSLVLRAGREVKLHRYDLAGRHSEGWNRWNFELIPRNETYHVVVVRQPEVEATSDSKELRKRNSESHRQRVETISPAFRLVDPQRYTMRVEMITDGSSDTSQLRVVSLEDAVGQDRTAELVKGDPQFGPPVDQPTRQKALELLERVETAAKPWNARPAKSIVSYQYDAVDAKGNRTPVTIDKESPLGPSWSDISRLRGFAYMPPLRWLFSQPENIIFRDVQIEKDRAVLTYQLKERRGFSAGLGVGPGWNGFFSRVFSAGKIVIDVDNSTVLEHRLSSGPLGEESIETFSEYEAVGEGYAPRTMRIEAGDFDFRLRFKIHKDTLWLLDNASHGDRKEPVLRIENVTVNLDAKEAD